MAREILRLLDHVPNVLILSQDSFYRYHEQDEIDLAFANELDFDHPSAIDFGLFKEVLEELRLGNSVEVSRDRFDTLSSWMRSRTLTVYLRSLLLTSRFVSPSNSRGNSTPTTRPLIIFLCSFFRSAIYSFVTHQRLPETQYLYGASVIIVEGILALQDESLRELFDLKGSFCPSAFLRSILV